MNDSKIVVRYTKALFLSAEEKNVLDQVKNDMIYVLDVCDKVSEFMNILYSAIIPASKKKIIIREVFSRQVNELTLDFLDLVVMNKREVFIPDIARRFTSEYKMHKGITSVTLTTATPVDRGIMIKIIDLIKKAYNTEVDMIRKVEKRLIGGFVLRIDDYLLDASVYSELEMIKRELTGKL
jgi:F-type H+-transporting ATPase subunit delta